MVGRGDVGSDKLKKVIPLNVLTDLESSIWGASEEEPDIEFRKRYGSRGFPVFADPLLFKEYMTSQKRQVDITSVIPLILIFYVASLTRFDWFGFNIEKNAIFIAAFVISMTTNFFFVLFIVAQAIMIYARKQNRYHIIYRIAESFVEHSFFGKIEDLLCIIGTLNFGLYLLARVYAGQCTGSTDIWKSQSCNPVAGCNSIPHDQVILVYAVPIASQIIMRGVSVYALTIVWLSAVIFVILAIIHVEGYQQLWTILYSAIFMNISYEMERSLRVGFVQRREIISAEDLKRKQGAKFALLALKNSHELELLQISTENEKKMRELESFHLRSLMGNVAHDLKTPLHSIEVDLEVLHDMISKVPIHCFLNLVDEFGKAAYKEINNPEVIFESLDATCKFMTAAINRSQDFMKASNNIALVPSMETFDLRAAVMMAITCIDHLSIGTTIVHHFHSRICSSLISDKHWLVENLLCLLSNAVKYSDGGIVDLKLRLVNRQSLEYLKPSEESATIKAFSKMNCCTDDANTTDTSDLDSDLENGNDASMVLITVSDTGIGISESDQKNLFQPFKQTQRMAGGTGLGLYSLSKRVDALGGRCGCSSRTDDRQGTMFWFYFPYRPDRTAGSVNNSATGYAESKRQSPNTSKKYEYHSKQLKILVIDDSLSVLKVTTRLLQTKGHTVVTATNGFLGLKRLESAYSSDYFDMVLSDLQMPVMDGLEATKRYRKFEEGMKTAESSRRDSKQEDMLESFAESALRHADRSDTYRESNRELEEDIDRTSISLCACDKNRPRRRSRLLIVGMSANSDSATITESSTAGMDNFLTKPFSYLDLLSVINSHFGGEN